MKQRTCTALNERVRVIGLVERPVGAFSGGSRWSALVSLRPWRRVTDRALEKLELVVTRSVTQAELRLLQERLSEGTAVVLHVHLREQWPNLLKGRLLDLDVRPAEGFEAAPARTPRHAASGPLPALVWTEAGWSGKAQLAAFAGFRDAMGPYGKLKNVSRRGTVNLSVDAETPSRPPSTARVSAYSSFVEDQAGAAAAVVEALVREAPRLSGIYPAFPSLRSVADVKKHVGLHCVHVRADRRIGLELGCSWDPEHGLGVLLSGKRVVALGSAEVAFEAWSAPKRSRKKTAR